MVSSHWRKATELTSKKLGLSQINRYLGVTLTVTDDQARLDELTEVHRFLQLSDSLSYAAIFGTDRQREIVDTLFNLPEGPRAIQVWCYRDGVASPSLTSQYSWSDSHDQSDNAEPLAPTRVLILDGEIVTHAQLSAIPKRFTGLSLAGCDIKSLKFFYLPNHMDELFLNGCPVDTLNFSQIRTSFLDLSQCDLSSLPKLVRATQCRVSHLRLRNVNFLNMDATALPPSISTFDIQGSSLKGFTLRNYDGSIQELLADQCCFDTVSFSEWYPEELAALWIDQSGLDHLMATHQNTPAQLEAINDLRQVVIKDSLLDGLDWSLFLHIENGRIEFHRCTLTDESFSNFDELDLEIQFYECDFTKVSYQKLPSFYRIPERLNALTEAGNTGLSSLG